MNEINEIFGDEIEIIEEDVDIHKFSMFPHYIGVRLKDGHIVIVYKDRFDSYTYCHYTVGI